MLVGVWYQNRGSFPTWKRRGIGTLIGYENEGIVGTAQLDGWCADARAAGLSYVLQGVPITQSHWNDGSCSGLLLLPDEPNGVGNAPASQMATNAAAVKAVAPNKPLWISLDGGRAMQQSDAELAAYCAVADVLMFDAYPLNYSGNPAGIPVIGQIADRIKKIAPTKMVVAVLEASNQDIGKQPWTLQNDATGTPLSPKLRAPTPAEFIQEVETAVAHNVGGVVYFPDKIGLGWEGFDGVVEAGLEGAMISEDAKLNAPPPVVTHTDTPTPTPAPVTPTPQPAPSGYTQAYVHLRSYDFGKTWRVVVP